MPQALPRKLYRLFVWQSVTAGVLMVLGLLLACLLVLNWLIDARLQVQADEYRAALAIDPGHPLPRTEVVQAYLVDDGDAGALPAELAGLPPGVHRLQGPGVYYAIVEEGAQGTLYVRMSFRSVSRVVWSVMGLLMLGGFATVYLVFWSTYRNTRRLVEPVAALATRVSQWQPDAAAPNPTFAGHAPDELVQEVEQLTQALDGLSDRVKSFVVREQEFTRDASHELRTPLTVIRMAADILVNDRALGESQHRLLQRIQQAGRDMEAVLDSLLLLAREEQWTPGGEPVDVAEIVDEQLHRARSLLDGKPVELRRVGEVGPQLVAPRGVVSVIIGQLLDNACSFTEQGLIQVELSPDGVVIADTGIGMTEDTLQRVYDPFFRADPFRGDGKGMGLSVVNRLVARMGWDVAIESAPGEGTRVSIVFSEPSPIGDGRYRCPPSVRATSSMH